MKISDIAKKLSISIKEVRDKAKELDFAIAQKSQTLSDKKAKEFIEKIQHSRKQELPKEEEKKSEEPVETEEEKLKEVFIPDVLSVKQFSERLDLPVTRVITELMKSGVIASINENIDFETAEIVGEYLGFKVKKTKVGQGVSALKKLGRFAKGRGDYHFDRAKFYDEALKRKMSFGF